jgi:POT family proton-dependent oligopeptide transporter
MTETIQSNASSEAVSTESEKQFFGHPFGLSVLFFTEFWERFSYYGMRAILLLFLTSPALASPEFRNIGLGFDTATAGFVYGLYTAMAYLAAVPGGWIADNLLGQRRAVFIGGILIAAGNLVLSLHGFPFMVVGLTLIVLGTGLLKPNVSAMVGGLYHPSESSRRDAAFSIFYMGINFGGFAGPLVVGSFGEQINWHLGFLSVGIGMIIGVIWFWFGTKHLGDVGLPPSDAAKAAAAKRTLLRVGIALLGVIALTTVLHFSTIMPLTISTMRTVFNVAYIVIPAAFFIVVFSDKSLSMAEKKRFIVIGIFFVLSAVFWGSFEQAGTTFVLFARDSTNRVIGNFTVPVSYFQSLNSMFIVIFASVFAWMWVKLGDRQPPAPMKFAIGLILVGVGFLVLSFAATIASGGTKVTPMWLIAVFCIHTFGELCLSPVGLSNITKLAPTRYVSQAMGIWFLGSSVGNYIAGQAAGTMEQLPASEVFLIVFAIAAGIGLVVAIVAKPITNLMGGVK